MYHFKLSITVSFLEYPKNILKSGTRFPKYYILNNNEPFKWDEKPFKSPIFDRFRNQMLILQRNRRWKFDFLIKYGACLFDILCTGNLRLRQ